MARIVDIQIKNFRSIKQLWWQPSKGVNCLIGPGDSGKSSVLDAIDFCLGARRNLQFTDADFHRLNTDEPIVIDLCLGELDDALKNLDGYGLYLRGYDETLGLISDEPGSDLETVLCLRLTVANDLEPVWSLVSDRAAALGQSRNLAWTDRIRLAPTRIGTLADYHLAWRRGSVLNRLSEERANASAALALAAREARKAFGTSAEAQLKDTLKIVADTAASLGISVGADITAMLDAHSVSFNGGTISLHDAEGVPLSNLGTGSTRLLIAGLQRKAAESSAIVLIDELEHGLEPHRIIRLLDSIGAKEANPPLQAFVTTHSPVALRELQGSQLTVLRGFTDQHVAQTVGSDDAIQGTIRSHPDAFLAPSIIVCEGASEVGLLRGLYQFYTAAGLVSLTAYGVALVDAGGCSKIYRRANALRALNYRVAVFRDDDVQPVAADEAKFTGGGGTLVCWRPGHALEKELCLGLPDAGILALLELAVELHSEALIDQQLKSASAGKIDIAQCRAGVTDAHRQQLASVAGGKTNPWFKSVTAMAIVGQQILGPHLDKSGADLRQRINQLSKWISAGVA